MSWALVYPRLPGCSTVLGRVAQRVVYPRLLGCSTVFAVDRRSTSSLCSRPACAGIDPLDEPSADAPNPARAGMFRSDRLCSVAVLESRDLWLGSPVGDSPVGLLVSIPLLGSLFLFSELRPVEAPCSWSDVNRSALLRPAGAGCFAPRRRSSVACSPSGDGGFWRRGGVAAGPERAWDRLVGSRSRGCRVDGRRWLSVSWLVSIAGCPAGPAVPWAVAGFSPGS